MQSEQPTFQWTQWIALFVLVAAMGAGLGIMLILQWFPEINAALGPYYLRLVSWPLWAYFTALPVLVTVMYAASLGVSALARTAVFAVAVGGLATWATVKASFPLGALTYTTWIGPLVLDEIPLFIPLAWFSIALVSVDLARRFTDSQPRRVLLAVLFLMLWDGVFDSAMSRAFPLWIYADSDVAARAMHAVGAVIVSSIMVAGMDRLVSFPGPTHRWAAGVWTVSLLYPAAISLLYGHVFVAFTGGLTAMIPLVMIRIRRHW